MKCENSQGAAKLGAAEGGGFAFGERAEIAGTMFDDLARQVVGERGSASAGTHRIGKDVEISEGAGFNKSKSGGMVGIGFAGEAGDNVGTDGRVWQMAVDEFDSAGVVFGAVPATHGGEDAVRSGLEGHVKMGRDAIGCGEEFDEVPGYIEWFDRADADALDRRFIQDAAQ